MKIFICTLGCECHPDGTAVVLAFNRGHAVKLLNKKMKDEGYDPLLKDEFHVVRELDPSDPAYKKGHVTFCFND